MKKLFLSCLSVALLGGLAMAGGHEKGTLAAVKSKGHIQCGVSQGLPGFSNPDDQGNWSGLDVDFCRAMAAAVFGAHHLRGTPPLGTGSGSKIWGSIKRQKW